VRRPLCAILLVAACATPVTPPRVADDEPVVATSSHQVAPDDAGAADVAPHGGLAAAQVRQVVMSNQGHLRACYDKMLATEPDLRGMIVVSWRVDVDGHVMASKIVRSSMGSPDVEACVLSEMGHWEFPSSNAPTYIAEYPFKFGVRK